MVPPPKTDLFAALTSLTPIQLAMALQCHCKLDGFKIQDSRFLRTLSSKSWIQDSRFKIPRDSFEQILNPNLESNPWIQDSRFKIPGDSFQQILNPGFKIQDSRFPGTLCRKSWIQDFVRVLSLSRYSCPSAGLCRKCWTEEAAAKLGSKVC